MPEQSPDHRHPDHGLELATTMVADDDQRGTAPDQATLYFAGVEAGFSTRRKKGRLGWLGLGGWLSVLWLGLIMFLAIFGPYLPGIPNAKNDVGDLRLGWFASGHIFGTDNGGHDVFSLIVNGTRNSMAIAFFAVFMGFMIGGVLGVVAGYFKGRIGGALGAVTDILLAYPQLVLALSVVRFLGDSVWLVAFALGIVSTPVLARISRASTLSWSEREFVVAARAQGAKHTRVMLREILPNVLPAMLSIALLGVAVVIIAEAGLAIVGAGVDPNVVTWGRIIEVGRADINDAPNIVLAPSIVIFFTVLALNYLGDVLRARFDVREGAL